MLLLGMVLVVGPALVIEIVEQSGEGPQFLIGSILPRVRAQAGLDSKGVFSQAFALRVFAQKFPGILSITHSTTSGGSL
jgi:hypothetical protein